MTRITWTPALARRVFRLQGYRLLDDFTTSNKVYPAQCLHCGRIRRITIRRATAATCSHRDYPSVRALLNRRAAKNPSLFFKDPK